LKVVSDEEQKILDCYRELALREVMDFKVEVESRRMTRKLARRMLHGTLSIFIGFLNKGKEEYIDEMIRRFERLIDKGGKR
jgi:hypothetical protein